MLKVLFPWKQNNTKKVIYAMEQVLNEAGPSAEESPPDDLSFLPCHVCNRTFLPNPLKKHIPICEQMARKKRKPFDSLKQRVEGTDMATFFQKSYLKKANPAICIQVQAEDVNGNNKQSKWRERHFELQKTIKNAKGSKSDMSAYNSNSPFVTPNKRVAHLTVNQNSTNERCPVCKRSFGPKAFDRHVEFCKEQRNRVQVHKSPAVVQQAKERLEARINYRVPPLRQSKRAVVRDKYATSSQHLLSRSNSIASNKSTTSVSSSATTMLPNRRQISNNVNTNERNNKKEVGSKTRLDKIIGDCGDTKESTKSDSNINKSFTKTTNNINYDPFEKAHLQLLELQKDDAINVTSTSPHTNTISTRSTPTIEFRPFATACSTPIAKNRTIVVKPVCERASVIDPPYNFQDNRHSRHLEKEFELLESLMNNNMDETSDRALADKKLKDFSDELNVIDPNLINEQDNLIIPEHLPSDEHSPDYNIRYTRRLREPKQNRPSRRPTKLAIKPLPLIKTEVRLAPDGSSAESQEGRRASPKLFQSNRFNKSKIRIDFSSEAQKSKNNRGFGNASVEKQASLEVRKALAEETEDIPPKLDETFSLSRTPTAEELYPDNPMMYEEFRKYEEIYRREKEGRNSSSKKQKKNKSDFGINMEDFIRTYGDSAYGSLNRKQQIDEGFDEADKLLMAMPPITSPEEKLPKFCHECGNKYPVATAKFCVQCGIKRLIL